MKLRLRTVIFGTYVASSAIGFTILMVFILWDVRPRYVESMRRTMHETAKLLAVMLETRLTSLPPEQRSVQVGEVWKAELKALETRDGMLRVYVTDHKGIVIGDSSGGRDIGRDYTKRYEFVSYYGLGDDAMASADLVQGELRVSVPVSVGGERVGVVGVGRKLSTVQQFIFGARLRLFTAGMGIAGVMVLAGWYVSSKVAHSLERLTDYVRALKNRESLPALRSHAVEVEELARAFDEMREALEGKAYVERYTQSLAHEIKAPLTAIRGAAEILAENPPEEERQRFLANLRNEAERLRQIVDRLLQLAAVEARRAPQELEQVDLGAVLREVADRVKSAGLAEGRTLSLSTHGSMTVQGDAFLLRQAVDNLVLNALEFSAPGGQVELQSFSENDKVCVRVEDRGPGVPEYALPRVFERFYSLPRPATGRKSTGLGLSLVAEVARLHGGSARLTNREGGGARAELWLAIVR